MKRNLISVVILALLIVNIVLSAITMFSVVSTNSKTAALVTDVAAAVRLDLSSGEIKEPISMADVVTHDIAEMIIPLKIGEDGASHFFIVSITLSMDSKHADYATYGETLGEREGLICGEINDAVGSYTLEEARNDSHAIEDEILKRIQAMFDSDFIFNVTFSGIKYQ